MPAPNTRINLNAAILAGGGYTLTANAGDLTATTLGQIGPHSVGSVTDLNGDGIPDLIIGTPGNNGKGADIGGVFITLGAPAPGSTTELGHLATSISIDGIAAGDSFGFAVGSSSDMNGDGRGEILASAPGMDVAGMVDAGVAFVLWGQATGIPAIDLTDAYTGFSGGFAIKGQAAGDLAGYSMTSVGDMNGDGIADVLVGSPGQDAGGVDAGAAYIVWGKATGTPVSLGNVAAGVGGFRIVGAAAGDRVGETLAVLGDQNGDGKSEVVLASHSANGGAGAVYVVDGKATGGQVNLTDLAAGIGGYQITGVAGDGAGSTVADAGDVNGDGRHDILIGAAGSNSAYVVYGQSGHAAVNLSDVANGVGGFHIIAENAGDLANMVVLGGQDLNRDGITDLVIGASHNGEGGANAGAVYVVWGGQGNRTIDLSAIAQGMGGAKIVGASGALTGASIGFAGDLNGDGTVDLVIGQPGTGEQVQVLYTPISWQPDANIYGTNGNDIMTPGYGGGTHLIGAGNDTILALAGNDSVDAGAGNDSVEGGAGNDTLLGSAGNDLLDGGTGNDSLAGGIGDDTFSVDSTGDMVIEAPGEGNDSVLSSVNFTLGANVEALTLTGFAQTAIGNDLGNTLRGNAQNNDLWGMAGNDTMIGGAGNDTYRVTETGDVVVETLNNGIDTVESTVNLTLSANVENLTLLGSALKGTGNSLLNTIIGNALNNVLDGGTGADVLRGGLGNDSYRVDNAGDQAIELAGEGNDTIIASIDYVLGDGVETLTLTGAAHHGTGNAADNTLIGTSGGDTLDGGAGNDKLVGGLGDDTYIVDTAFDAISEGKTGGVDTVVALVDYTLGAKLENLTLSGSAHSGTGNTLANHLIGTALADVLNGGAGADTMDGGAGNDSYVVDNAGDVVNEAVGGGTDTIQSGISLTLGLNVENLTLTSAGHTGTGNADANLLLGSTGADTLMGMDGNDTIDGGSGPNLLIGGAGDDTYIIRSASDVVVESVGGGTDTAVLMSDGLTVADNIEIVRLDGTAHSFVGGAGDSTIEGSSGADSIDGGAGNDLLLAGDGNDVLTATSGHDVLSGGSGDDTYHIHGASADIQDFLGHDTLDTTESASNDRIDLSGETDSEVEHEVVDETPGGTTAGPLDVQFLQDLTGSFADDIATVRGLVPQIVTALQAIQANSEFGVSSFVDKPVSPFGAPGEWVYQQEQALSANAATLLDTYNRITTHNGLDGPEAQLEALMQLALHSVEAGFRPDAARFVVLFTDAPFHVAGDGAAGGITTANNGDAFFGDGSIEDYPFIAQVRAALEAANIIPVFAIAGGYESTYQGLADALGRGTVVSLTANSSNIVDAITAGITTATTTHIEDEKAGSGDDTVLGGVEDNSVWGNAGNDSIDGRTGNDSLYGGDGNDLLIGGAGNDLLAGGAGDDTVVMTGARADYTISLTPDGLVLTDLRAGTPDGTDRIGGVEHFSFLDGTFAASDLIGSVISQTLTAGADTFTALTDDHYVVAGLGGADIITTLGGYDTITGGAGNDLINAGGGDDTFNFSGSGEGFDAITGGAGFDRVQALTAGTVIGLNSVAGVEEITANGNAGVIIRGDGAANVFDFSATTLTGIQRIEGGAGADTITGSAGADVILGGTGRDVLAGGAGADSFVFTLTSESARTAPDMISDFQSGVDRIDLGAIDANTLLASDQAFAFIGGAIFSHVAGELRLAGAGAGILQLSGDVNGDGIADFAINLAILPGSTPVLADLIL